MNTSLIAKIMIVVSFFLFMGVGVWVSKRVKNAEDYYVMGRQAPTFLVTGTIVASYLSKSFPDRRTIENSDLCANSPKKL